MVTQQERKESLSKIRARIRARKALEQQGRMKKIASCCSLVGFVVLLFLFLAGRTTTPHPRKGKHTIPADVTYTVIDTNVIPGIKRSLDIRLNRRVSEEVLRSIALELERKDPREYERTFISYYLSGHSVGAGGWATTHFNPDLEVRILGVTGEQAESFVHGRDDPSRDVLGKWLWDGAGARISLYRHDGKLYMEQKYKDESASNLEMVEETSPTGRRLEENGGSSYGEYYLIDRQGNLQIRDSEGLIATATKIE